MNDNIDNYLLHLNYYFIAHTSHYNNHYIYYDKQKGNGKLY
jgi:hypothetical protein